MVWQESQARRHFGFVQEPPTVFQLWLTGLGHGNQQVVSVLRGKPRMKPKERARYLDTDWVGFGWTPIVKQLDKDLAKIDRRYTIDQIKEKFGGLRYYYSQSPSLVMRFPILLRLTFISKHIDRYHAGKGVEMSRAVRLAERECLTTCEACGNKEALIRNQGGWNKTLCGDCA